MGMKMNGISYWDQFAGSGNVEDYLKYKQCRENEIDCPAIKPIRPKMKKSKGLKKIIRPQYMIEDEGTESADTANHPVPALISCFAIPLQKTVIFRRCCSAGTDHKMEIKIVRFVPVPFPLMLMRRLLAANSTFSVTSINVIF